MPPQNKNKLIMNKNRARSTISSEKSKTQIGKSKRERTYKAVIVNCEDILLLRDHVAKTATSRVFEGNAGGFGTENPVNIVTVIQLIIKAFRDVDDL